jgi:hypothetical protein
MREISCQCGECGHRFKAKVSTTELWEVHCTVCEAPAPGASSGRAQRRVR